MKRQWFFWLLVLVFAGLVVTNFGQVRNLAETLAQGEWRWLLTAAALQGLYYVTLTALYQSAFDTVRVRSRLYELLPVTFASIFLNVAEPVASGMALFVDDAARRGQSPARASAGTLLVTVANYSAFLLVLTAGLVYLSLQRDLQIYEPLAAGVLLLMLGVLVAVLFLGLWYPKGLLRLLGWVQRLVNGLAGRFKRPELLAAGWADKSAVEFTAAAAAIVSHPRRLGRTVLVALAMHIVNMASLYVLFMAFHQIISIGGLVAGFAMGMLFSNVSITPQGIGTSEGAMTLVYSSLGVPATRATVVTLAFRGLTLWLPLLIGFLLLRGLRSFKSRGPAQAA